MVIDGLAKFDLWAADQYAEPDQAAEQGRTDDRRQMSRLEGVIRFGAGRCGSEAVFVPRCSSSSSSGSFEAAGSTEDGGYILCLVHDEATE
jgi:carotenoid cleavage dioxygenase-like enzyme